MLDTERHTPLPLLQPPLQHHDLLPLASTSSNDAIHEQREGKLGIDPEKTDILRKPRRYDLETEALTFGSWSPVLSVRRARE